MNGIWVRVLSYAPDGAVLAETTLSVEQGADARPVDLAWASGQLYVALTSHRTEDGAAYVLASSYVHSGLFGVADRYLVLKYTAAERRVWTELYGDSGLPKALGVTADGRFVATGHDGTASWVEGDAKACDFWWPGCW